ncbi:hypothetical protein MSAN_00456400 [Mycena sanguinolenta]|uniref:Uncharacterized protein n=1 Tax=Mycena sanguinolenta TaxID=230812 RepID=A0A8H7DKH7_9AGAR|nr:hypothetical protein MSAN_00456400 [Mycena sanguinolenta]
MSLPQACNPLSPAERSRLVRSNRKLQVILGASPELIEAAVSRSTKRHEHTSREAVTSSTPPVNAVPSLSDRRLLRPTTTANPTRPQLILHLQPPTILATPSGSTLSTPLSPSTNTTPTTPPPTLSRPSSAKDTRRPILQENIAPDVAEQPTTRPFLRRATTALGGGYFPPQRRVRTAASTPVDDSTLVPPTVLGHGYFPSQRRRRTTASTSVEVSALVPPVPPLPQMSSPLEKRGGKPLALARSFSTAKREPRLPRAPDSSLTAREARELADELEGAQILTAVRHDLRVGVVRRRQEAEWIGEWNCAMDQVAKELRALK